MQGCPGSPLSSRGSQTDYDARNRLRLQGIAGECLTVRVYGYSVPAGVVYAAITTQEETYMLTSDKHNIRWINSVREIVAFSAVAALWLSCGGG